MWLSRAGLVLLTTVSVGAIGAPAQAAATGVASVVSTRVQYEAAKGKQNRVVLTRFGNTVTVDDTVAVKAGKGCRAVKGDKTRVTCRPSKAPTRLSIYTYDRNDTVINRTDLAMTADGGTGNDKIWGGPRADTIWGDSGSDTIRGLGGRDNVVGDDGNDALFGDDGDDILDGGTGHDMLSGGNGHDSMHGMGGNDREYGGPGVDTFWETFDPDGPDADLFSGGADEDSVTYITRERAVVADNDGVKGDDGSKGEGDSIGADVEVIGGGDGNDWLSGNDARTVLYGFRGNDTLIGRGGDDALNGGPGADRLFGGDGNDGLSGDEGSDAIYGQAGDDNCQPDPSDSVVDC